MDFENTFAECIRKGDIQGIRALCLDNFLVNEIFTCPTPVEQISGKFMLPAIDSVTPIVYAILCQQKEIVEELLLSGANLSVFVDEWQPIHYAVGSRNIDIAETLINYDINQLKLTTRSNKNSPLHIAVSASSFDLVVCLLKAGHDPNIQNKSGNTPLHLAVYSHSTSLLSALIAFGANPEIRNNQNLTALDVAKLKHMDRSVQYLESIANKTIPIPTREETIAEYEKVPANSQQSIKEKSDLLDQRVSLAEETVQNKK